MAERIEVIIMSLGQSFLDGAQKMGDFIVHDILETFINRVGSLLGAAGAGAMSRVSSNDAPSLGRTEDPMRADAKSLSPSHTLIVAKAPSGRSQVQALGSPAHEDEEEVVRIALPAAALAMVNKIKDINLPGMQHASPSEGDLMAFGRVNTPATAIGMQQGMSRLA